MGTKSFGSHCEALGDEDELVTEGIPLDDKEILTVEIRSREAGDKVVANGKEKVVERVEDDEGPHEEVNLCVSHKELIKGMSPIGLTL